MGRLLCMKISTQGDPQFYEHILARIAERYGHSLYQPVPDGEPADLEVRISRPERDPIFILDEFRHTALQWKLCAEFGRRVEFADLSEAQIAEDLSATLRYRIVPEAQIQLFQSFLDDLPAFLSSCFPISSPEAPFEVRLGGIRLIPPRDDPRHGVIATRWYVRAQLSLVDNRDGRTIDSGWFWLCNFFGPRDDGRITEPAQKRQRVLDDDLATFHQQIRGWLSSTIAERLAGQPSDALTIRGVFEFED